mmetsp:Transcript_98476/g.234445  ORF Transcript_98476/g.234445 Transcript_98476/m.234445 type:complete len:326 (-) Transcript_98476:131-1108(-)
MYYVCQGCSGACNGCGNCCSKCCQGVEAACSGCGKAIDDMFGACCAGLGAACGACCLPFVKIWERPLGSYVVLCWLFNLPTAILSAIELTKPEVQGCTRRNLTAIYAFNLVASILHAAFALYLQSRLASGLAKAEAELRAPSAKELMKRAWDIVLYDFVFLFYIFVLLGSIGFNCYAAGWPFLCGEGTFWPILLQMLFFFAAIQFAILWFCMLSCTDCCRDLLPVRILLGKRGETVAQPQVVGQPQMVTQSPQVPRQAQSPHSPQHPQQYPQQQPQPSAAQAMYVPPASAPPESSATRAQQAAAVGGAALEKLGKWFQDKGRPKQ